MSAGNPLDDNDRLPWLALIRSTAERICRDEWNDQGFPIKSVEDGGIGRPGIVIACSALKKWYRDILRGEVEARPPGKEDLVSCIAICEQECRTVRGSMSYSGRSGWIHHVSATGLVVGAKASPAG